MDDLIAQQIKLANETARSNVPWTTDEPWPQPYYSYSTEQHKWVAIDSKPAPSGQTSGSSPTDGHISTLALYAWNIDFMLPHPDSRMRAAIAHLRSLVDAQTRPSSSPAATVIFLQECLVSDLTFLANNAWIRSTFLLSDLDGSNWRSGHYGTLTLLDRRLASAGPDSSVSLFRVHYSKTRMERDALFADLVLGGKRVRLCNTHLESLAFEPAYRPPQLALAAQYMRGSSADGVDGAVLAGDLNAIQDFDRTLHLDNGLEDAYLEQGGREEDAAAGHTWGQQTSTVLRARFGTSRMDKVLFCGGVLRLESFERFGQDVLVEDAEEAEEIVALGFEKAWVTDHYGVKAVFSVGENGGRL